MKKIIKIFSIIFLLFLMCITINAQENRAVFDDSEVVNVKLKKLAGNVLPTASTTDNIILEFKRTYNVPVIEEMTSDNIISKDDSFYPIYAWFDNGIIYYYTEDEHPILENGHSLFLDFKSITSIDLTTIDTSRVENMSYMFQNCSSLISLDLSDFDTSNVEDMSGMFLNCEKLSSVNLSSFNTSKVTNMHFMFKSCNNLKNLDLSNFDTSNVTNMSEMFAYSGLKSINLDGWDTSKVENMNRMFYMSSVEVVRVSDKWDTSNISYENQMFSYAYSIVGMNGTSYDESKTDKTYARVDANNEKGYFWNYMPQALYWAVDGNCDNITEERNCKLTVSNNEIIGNHYDSGIMYYSGWIDYDDNEPSAYYFNGWIDYNRYITEVKIGSEDDIIRPLTTAYWFREMYYINELDLQYLDTLNVTDMREMFYDCRAQVISVSDRWDISNVKNSKNMFLYSINVIGANGTKYDSNIVDKTYARVDTDDEKGYFWDSNTNPIYWAVDGEECRESTSNCELTISNNIIPGNHFDSGISVGWLKYKNSIVNVNLGSENDIIVVNQIKNWFNYMRKLQSLDLQYLDTSNVTDMGGMFKECTNLESINLSNLNTSKVWNMIEMFSGCTSLKSIDLSSFDTSKLSLMDNMFENCSSLTSIDISNFNTSRISSNTYLFSGCTSLTNVKLPTELHSHSIERMFSGCTSLKSVDLSNFDTSEITNMSYLFAGCINLEDVNLNINTSNVTNMAGMFQGCEKLENIDLSHFDTSKVKNMERMFEGCSSIIDLDLRSFNTSKVTNMQYMFRSCRNLQVIAVSDDWDVTSVNNDICMFNNNNFHGMSGILPAADNTSVEDCKGKERAVVDAGDNYGYLWNYIPQKLYWVVDGECDSTTGDCKLILSSNKIEGNYYDSGKTIYKYDWTKYNDKINEVELGGPNDIIIPVNTRFWFSYMNRLKVLDLSYLDVSNVNDFYYMFNGSNNLEKIIVSDDETKTILENASYSNINRSTKIYLNHLVIPELSIKKGNDNSLKIQYTNSYADKYRIYRSTKKDSGFKLIKETTKLEFLDTKLTYDKKYYYRVVAIKDNDSITSDLYSKKLVPDKVENLRIVSVGTNNIKIRYKNLYETGYEIYSSTDNKKWTKLTTITKNSISEYNAKKLKNNKKYYFKVRAYKTVKGKKIYGSFSDVVSTTTAPFKPKVTLSIKDISSMNLKIAASKGASKYIIQKSVDDEAFELLDEVTEAKTYVQENQDLGINYNFRVKACNEDDRCSSWVKVSLKQTPKTPGLKLTTKSKKVIANITSVEGAGGYQLYMATKKNGKYKKIMEFTSEEELLEFTSKTKKGVTYYYKVRSYTIVDDISRIYSPYSKIKSIKSK